MKMPSHSAGRPIQLLVTLAVTSLLLLGCDNLDIGSGETGSGNLATETREVAPFTSVDVSSAIVVLLAVDPASAQSVSVTYDDNLLDNLVTRVADGTLILEFDGSVNISGGANRFVEITVPELESIEASGASRVTAIGPVPSYRIEASGASQLDLRGIFAEDIEIEVSGASDVDLYATGTVTGEVSGASDLVVFGEPDRVDVDSSGASNVDVRDMSQ